MKRPLTKNLLYQTKQAPQSLTVSPYVTNPGTVRSGLHGHILSRLTEQLMGGRGEEVTRLDRGTGR